MATRKPKADKAAEEPASIIADELQEKTETALAPLPPQESAMTVYTTAGGLDPWLERIRTEVSTLKPDLTTKKGRDEIASVSFKVRKAKTALDDLGLALATELKEAPKKIDAERKRMREILDALAVEVRQPLTEWEEAEEAKVRIINEKIKAIELYGADCLNSEALSGQITALEFLVIDDEYGDFKEAALELKDDHLRKMRTNFATLQKAEADAIELAKLRHEAAEREQKEREQRIAEEAAQKARDAAAAEIVERERLAAKAIADAEALAKATKDAADRRELELQLQASEAERKRVEQEQKSAQDAKDAAERAERDKAAAIQREKDRAAQEAAMLLAEAKRREENKAHAKKINNAAMQAIMDNGNVTQEQATAIVIAIVKGQVPNVVINY
jgi:hypothetical protein